ncbi:MAG: PKD domain-containing protein [Planctomycetes bacterium]|nr:PKD domain-containing protein [Planctomycetota bacterium]
MDDNANVTLAVRAMSTESSNGSTASTTLPLAVTVANVAPTATLANNGPVNEGSPVTISLGSQTDPSTADTAVGFHYAVAWDGGSLAGTTYANSGSSPSMSHTFDDGPGDYTVRVRIIDKDNGFTEYTTVVYVDNVPPMVSLSGPASAVRGQTCTFTLQATDVSATDQAVGFVYAIDWGDGSTQTLSRTAGNGMGTTADHIYSTTGTYTVQVTATDKDGGVSSMATGSITIQAVGLQGGTLVVGGTTDTDTLRFTPTSNGDIQVTINNVDQGTFTGLTRLVAYGQAGDDMLLAAGVTIPVELYGGDGNDLLKGGNSSNILVGGAGDDLLVGGTGRDLLIGGGGADRMIGNGGDDLLIGGTTAFDNDAAALAAIMAEWTSNHDYATRIANLTDTGTGLLSRLNGNYFLLDSGTSQTVFNDSSSDMLTGGLGSDWFFVGTADKVTDLSALDQAFIFGL